MFNNKKRFFKLLILVVTNFNECKARTLKYILHLCSFAFIKLNNNVKFINLNVNKKRRCVRIK